MMTISSNIPPILNLPRELFQANSQLSEKLMKMAVEEKVGESASPSRSLDVCC